MIGEGTCAGKSVSSAVRCCMGPVWRVVVVNHNVKPHNIGTAPAGLLSLATAVMLMAAGGGLAEAARVVPLAVDDTLRTATLHAERPATSLRLTVRAPACAAGLRLRVALDGVAIGRARLPRGTARRVRYRVTAGAGAHTLTLRVGKGPGCRTATVEAARLASPPAGRSTPVRRGAAHPIALGAAVPWRIGAGVARDADRAVSAHFDSITPENDLKMTYVMPERTRFEWTYADALAFYAATRGKRMHGHTLLWDHQLPGWLTRRDWEHDELAAILHDWVKAVVGRYRGRIDTWDVANELFEDDGSFTTSMWYRVLGEDAIELAFRYAREADPNAKLLLTDYDIEFPGPKQDAAFALAARLKAKGVPIDGIGFQTHWTLGVHEATEDELRAAYERFARLGLEVQPTEMDVAIPFGGPSLFQRQADAYARVARVCHDVLACTAMTVWGVGDKDSWRGAHAHALLFDDAYAAKPAYAAVRRALAD